MASKIHQTQKNSFVDNLHTDMCSRAIMLARNKAVLRFDMKMFSCLTCVFALCCVHL